MQYRIQESCEGIDWKLVRELLKTVRMGYYQPELHRKAFERSFAVVFVFAGEEMIGMGRALSDGAYQAALYDVAVRSEYQRRAVGKLIVTRLLRRVSGCNVILYASPGKQRFYAKWGFARLKTGMGLFLNPAKMKQQKII